MAPRRRHLAFEDVGSTNILALEAARAGDPGPLWITAASQSEGRGRRGRRWASVRGNLYATLLLVDPAPARHLANLPLVAALGVRNGIAALAGIDPDGIRIKWPNDVMASGAKTVGILIESEVLPDRRLAVAIGCGVNVETCPSDAPYAATFLRREGATGSLADIFASVANGVESALATWRRGEGFAAIRDDWIRHSVGVGEPCRVNLADRSVDGRFLELDPDGRLVLLTAAGHRETYSAGDLFLLRCGDGHASPAGAERP